MNKALTLSRLEALLARIRTRAAEPRRSAPLAAAAAPAAAPQAVAAPAIATPVVATPIPVSPVSPALVARAAPVAVAPPAPAPALAREAAISVAPEPESAVDELTLPPPPMPAGDQEFAVEVDMSDAIDAPEPSAVDHDSRGASASQERLAVADSVPPPSIPPAERADRGASLEGVDALTDDEPRPGDEDEDIEEAPISSRRAVVSQPEERLAHLAFGADEPPQRHTPPPKSGPLPAPPAGGEFEADITGVRKAETLLADDAHPPPAPSVLVPQTAKPNLASSADVADVIGEAQSFAPDTFVALLDASLSL